MARISVRQLWKAKLAGRLAATGWPEAPATHRTAFTGRVLGIDPSLRGTGLALIEFNAGQTPVLLSCRTVRVASTHTLAHCLGEIHRAVAEFVAEFDPRHVALEQTIYVQNVQTAQILGAARGAAIAAAALGQKEVFEYPPLRVKQAVVGRGHASKEQVARTVLGLVVDGRPRDGTKASRTEVARAVMSMLGHGRPLEFDQADAAGVALCHAFTWSAAD